MTVSPFRHGFRRWSPFGPSRARWATWALCLLAFAAAGRAQTVRWEASDSGDPAEVQLVFQDCIPDGNPQLPQGNGLAFTLEGTSTQTNMVNFNVTRLTILTYRVRSSQGGALQIPACVIQTNKGSIRVPAFTGGALPTAAQANIKSTLVPGSAAVWAGEVFPLTYTLDVSRRTFSQLGTNIQWDSAPLVIEDWSKWEPSESTAGGEPRLNIIARTRGYAKTPGPLKLNSATQLVNIQSGSVGFGFFQAPRVEQISVESNHPELTVRPLPTPAPASFNGAVGQFKLTSKVVPTSAAIGEPITWTLELTGTGNWPDIAGLPQREVSKDFSVVQPKAKRTPAEGKLFDAKLAEDVVLVPTRPGDYTLEPVDFSYFDPSSGTYKTISTPRVTLTITPPANTPAAPSQPQSAAATTGSQPPSASEKAPSPLDAAQLATLKSKVPTTPSGIPRDPLPGAATAIVPLAWRTLAWLLAAPFAVLLAFWALLAVRRAGQTDPLRPRREARARLAATLSRFAHAPDAPARAPLLLQWQHDVAVLFRLRHAAPTETALAAPESAAPDSPWPTLWREADRALYGADAALPADWVARAEAALAAERIAGFSPLRLFLPQNLLPFVAAVALAAIAVTHLARAAELVPQSSLDPAAAYRAGDFASAESLWSIRVAKNPVDPIARHNLSLALAQQDRWAEAAAQSAIAFVQRPTEPAIRWQLALACEKAGYVPAPLAHFLPAGPAESLAQLAAPGEWQYLLVAAACVFALGIALLLLEAYGRRSSLRRWSGLSLLLAALLVAGSAVSSLFVYGPTADRRAVVVWQSGVLRSIPTEADTTQKTTPLPAGSVAIVNKTLAPLPWSRLAFPNDQTGWVRNGDALPLWR